MKTEIKRKYSHRGGRKIMPIEEKKVQVFAMVKFKYLKEANAAIQEAIKFYR